MERFDSEPEPLEVLKSAIRNCENPISVGGGNYKCVFCGGYIQRPMDYGKKAMISHSPNCKWVLVTTVKASVKEHG